MRYKRKGVKRYDVRMRSQVALRSFDKTFNKGAYRARRNRMINDMQRQLRKMKDDEFKDYYEKLLGRRPKEPEVRFGITINDQRTVAIVPFGTLKKRVKDPEQERMRRGLLKMLSQTGKKAKAKTITFYEKRAKDGIVQIGKGRFNVVYVTSALRVLSKKSVYIYKPRLKESVLILENENGDRVFIAPFIP